MDDRVTILPYGHHVGREEMFMRKILVILTGVQAMMRTLTFTLPTPSRVRRLLITHSFQKLGHHLIQVLTSVSTVKMRMILLFLQSLVNKRVKESLIYILFWTTMPLNQVCGLVFSTWEQIPPFIFLSILQHKSNPQIDPDLQNVTKCVQNKCWS